jgi:hypothetical protein
VSPWLIVTTGWPAVTVTTGHALAGMGTGPLILAVSLLTATAATWGSVVLLRARNRPGMARRSTS